MFGIGHCFLSVVGARSGYKRSKVHLFNPGFLYFYKKESSPGAEAVGRVVRVSACALVEPVLVAVMWKMDALKARWSWAEICSTFPRCLCTVEAG